MDPIDSRKVLWDNVSALMRHRWGKENLTRLAAEAEIGPGSVTRIKAQTTSVGVELVDKLARVFTVETWQLLVPGMDPRVLPTLMPQSETERAFYEKVSAALRDLNNTGR